MIAFILVLSLCVHQCVPQFRYVEHVEIFYDMMGIFEPSATVQTLSFNESMRNVNLNGKRLNPTMVMPSRTDSYAVWRELCNHEEVRPIAIFGPQSPISDSTIREQCAKAQIPHLQAAWQPFDPDRPYEPEVEDEEIDEGTPPVEFDKDPENEDEEPGQAEEEDNEVPVYKNITINFYPDDHEIAIAFSKLLKYYGWENFAVLYEDDFGLLRIQKILAEYTTNYPIFVRKLDPDSENNGVFKELKQYKESRVLLDCHVDRIELYMSQAMKLKVVDHYQHYIFVSLDGSLHASKMINYPSNITWLSMTDFDALNNAQHYLASRVGAWKPSGGSPPVTSFQVTSVLDIHVLSMFTKYNDPVHLLQLEEFLMVDIANHLIEAVKEVEEQYGLEQLPNPTSHVCDNEASPWKYGAALQNATLSIQTVGVSGNIQFNAMGKRINYTLYVNEIYVNERNTIGKWESSSPEEITLEGNGTNAAAAQFTNKHFIIISRKAKPYFHEKEPCAEDDEGCNNDERFEGFSVDLVKAIFNILRDEWKYNYTYEFVHEGDKSYGEYDPVKKKWDGLIGDLLDKKADLAVCDVTITEERKKVVDFSVPFMTLGISILYTKEQKVVPGFFSFMSTYTFDVWLYTATAYCVVSMVLFVCARISPEDWENPQPCDKDPEELENIWNFKNCTWLTAGSIMTQGCDILPKAFGSRWVCAMWWFFAVIVCQTYIAQLSASMTSALANAPINSVDDLAKQTKIRYGAIKGGSTMGFFKNSNDKMYQSMYHTMINNDAVLVKSNDEGEKRVLRGRNKYAFFMESTSIDYKLKRDCNLKKVGGLLDSKDYGIAMPANSPFRSHINRAILRLKELTTLDQIKNTWWNEKYGAKDECDKPVDEDDVEGDLEMENLRGAFVVLAFGLFVCLFITAAEFMDEVRNIVVREQISHKEAFIKELKASVNFFQLQKPVLRNPSRAPSVVSNGLLPVEDRQARKAQAIENFMDLEKMPQ